MCTYNHLSSKHECKFMPKIWSLDWWWNNGVILEVSEFWFWLYWLQNMVRNILWCWRQTNLLCMRWSWVWLFSWSSVSKVEINGESGEGHGLHCLSIVSPNSNAFMGRGVLEIHDSGTCELWAKTEGAWIIAAYETGRGTLVLCALFLFFGNFHTSD